MDTINLPHENYFVMCNILKPYKMDDVNFFQDEIKTILNIKICRHVATHHLLLR